MQDIDKTINRLCAHIQTELVLRKPKSLKQMPELVTALAQLVEARAKLEATRPKVQDEMDISYILESITERLQRALKGGEHHENSHPAAGNRSDSCADYSGRGTCPYPGFTVPDASAAKTSEANAANGKEN